MEKDTDFIECDKCWQDSKHPLTICRGCYHNKEAIRKLQATVTMLLGHNKKYRKRIKDLRASK